MKKLISILAAAMLFCAFAAAETIYVTISDGQGVLALANQAVEVADADNDSVISIYDALFAAHEQAFEGGSAEGFEAVQTDYGMSISRLWGEENGGSYGYYVNNASAYSLTDPLHDGDRLQAYVFTDLETWNDAFCYFDASHIQAACGEEFELLLTVQTYDASWNEVLMPVEGAVITINGADSSFTTDAEGKAVVSVNEAGSYIISARSSSMTLVPPVCIAEIT